MSEQPRLISIDLTHLVRRALETEARTRPDAADASSKDALE